MNDICKNESDKTNVIIDIKCKSVSEYIMSDNTRILSRKIHYAPELESNSNYDDICGPWKFDTIHLRQYSHCNHLSFKLITSEDVTYMRKQRDRKSVLLFLGKNLNSVIKLSRLLII